MTRIGITGSRGRMGQTLVRELESGPWSPLSYGGGSLSGDAPEKIFGMADLVIDFTTPDATRAHVAAALTAQKPLVIGTTGLSAGDLELIQDAARTCPILYSANMSVGINLLAALVEQASSRLGEDFDIEIMETHHRNKVDAPSGTALLLGRATGREAEQIDRSGKRGTGTLGYAVQRGGDVIGEHSVTFFGPGERLELAHRAHDRSLFAKGALRAAQWLKDQPNGFYSMRDVLGL